MLLLGQKAANDVSPRSCAVRRYEKKKEKDKRQIVAYSLFTFSPFTFYLYPTEPSISIWMSRLSSTAYSIGSSRVNGSMKPNTIIDIASDSFKPRLIR